jgi:hypothetical protein
MGGTTCGYGALVVAILLSATWSDAAPDHLTQDRCTQHAQRAIAQYQAMMGHASCRIAPSPRWQNSFDNHYNACLLVPESATKAEEAARDSHSRYLPIRISQLPLKLPPFTPQEIRGEK